MQPENVIVSTHTLCIFFRCTKKIKMKRLSCPDDDVANNDWYLCIIKLFVDCNKSSAIDSPPYDDKEIEEVIRIVELKLKTGCQNV